MVEELPAMAEENVEIVRDVYERWRFRERGKALAAAGLSEKAMSQERD
jgi:hypothetical protein